MRTFCKLLFLSNNMPRFRSGTDAEGRRLRILHFNHKPETINPALKDELKEESSGILNWMIQGLVDLMREKTIPSGGPASTGLLNIFNQNNDPVGSFVAERCELGPSEMVIKQTLFDAFSEWCEDIGTYSEKLENFFFKTLKSRYPGIETSRLSVKGVRKHCLKGIGLNDFYSERLPVKPKPVHGTHDINPELMEKLRRGSNIANTPDTVDTLDQMPPETP